MAKNFAAMDARGSQETMRSLRDRLSEKAPRTARLDQLALNPRNPRYPDDDPEIIETAETLKTVGQLQAAVVVERQVFLDAYPGDEKLEKAIGTAVWVVVIGNRRLQAARLAGVATLDIRVAPDLRDADDIERAILVENIHRQQLPPLLEAQMLRRRLDKPGATVRSVGSEIGKSHTYVRQRIVLLDLLPEFKDLLRTRELGVKVARQLGALSHEEQRAAFERGAPYIAPEGSPRRPTDSAAPLTQTVNGAGAESGDPNTIVGNPVSNGGEASGKTTEDGQPEGARQEHGRAEPAQVEISGVVDAPEAEPPHVNSPDATTAANQAAPVGNSASSHGAVDSEQTSTPTATAAADRGMFTAPAHDPVELTRLIRAHYEPGEIEQVVELLMS